MYCRHCGKEVKQDARFCGSCGAPIGKVTPAPRLATRISPKFWIAVGALVGVVLIAIGGTFGLAKWNEQRATRLFAEANQLVQKGHDVEETSYGEAFEHYKAALDNAQTILRDYPSTSPAARLLQDSTLGPYTIEELDHAVVPEMQKKAALEGDPLAYTLVLTDRLQGAGPQVSALVDVAEKYIEAGTKDTKDKGLEILSQALDTTNTTKDPHISREQVLIRIAEGYAIAAELREANMVVQTIGHETDIYRARGYASIAKASARAGHLDQAISVVQTMKNDPTRLDTLVEIAQIAAAVGKVDHALRIAQSIDDTSMNGLTLGIIAEEYAKEHQFVRALQVVETLRGPSVRARTILAIAGQYNRISQFEKAHNLVLESLKIVETLQEPARSNLLLEVVLKLSGARGFDEAIKMVETIQGANQKAYALAEIAGLYAAASHFEKATAVAENLDEMSMNLSQMSENPKDMAYRNIAQQYAKLGEYDKAKEIYSRLKVEFKDEVLKEIAKSYAREGHFDLANKVKWVSS